MATAIRTENIMQMPNGAMGLQQAIEGRRALMRRGEITRENGQGGYTVLGPLIELRYELTPDHTPAPHLRPDIRGLVIDWGSPKTAPLVGMDKDKSLLLVVSKVPPLPELPDPSFALSTFVVLDGNRIPLASVPPEMRGKLRNADGSPVRGTDKAIERPRMMKQRFADHCAGTMGEFMVFRPLTEGLVKLAGISALQKVFFSKLGNDWPGFYLNPATGEAHFLGGQVELGRKQG